MKPLPRGFHPLVFGIYPIVVLYSFNVAELPASVVLKPILITLPIVVAVWALLTALLRNRRKAALITSLGVILFFSYGYVYESLTQSVGMRHRVLMPLWILLGLTGGVLAARARSDLLRICRLLDVASGALLIAALSVIGGYKWSHPGGEEKGVSEADSLAEMVPAAVRAQLPDIYYIILDAYAADSTLREAFQYDNSAFLERLKARGFVLPEGSRSNYPVTLLSMSSALNMDYLDRLAAFSDDARQNVPIYHHLIRDNRVGLALARLGYHQILINPPWEMFSGDFTYTLWHGSILSYWMGLDHVRAQTLRVFDQLEALPERREPFFVYAHIVCPHPPFVFGANGEPLKTAPGQNMMDESGYVHHLYVNQLRFVNQRTDSLLDHILARSRIKPIIILQSDHGPAVTRTLRQATAQTILQRFRILNAYLVPDSVRVHLYPGITPVNSFRTVLDYQFGQHYGRVPDRSHWQTPTQPTVLFRARQY